MNEPKRILRRPRVMELTGLSDSALDRAVRTGVFPAPFKLLPDSRARAVGWDSQAVQTWIAERIEAAQQVST